MIFPLSPDIPPDYKKYTVLRDKINELIYIVNDAFGKGFPKELIISKESIDEYLKQEEFNMLDGESSKYDWLEDIDRANRKQKEIDRIKSINADLVEALKYIKTRIDPLKGIKDSEIEECIDRAKQALLKAKGK